MNSKFKEIYQIYNWDNWEYVGKAGIRSLKNNSRKPIPPHHGVYLILAPVLINRVSGCSNVIYIGQSGGGRKKGIQGIGPCRGNCGRLFNKRGFDDWVLARMHLLYPNSIFNVECYFTTSLQDPIIIERSLLKAYAEDHFELPPGNNQSFDYRSLVKM